MADLRTDYKDQLLDTSVNSERRYNLVDSDGNVVQSGVSLSDVTVYSQEGDSFGAGVLNGITGAINDLNDSLSALNAENKITSYEVVEGDGVYINYLDGADTVRKKLGSKNITIPSCILIDYVNQSSEFKFECEEGQYSNVTVNVTFVSEASLYVLCNDAVIADFSMGTHNVNIPSNTTSIGFRIHAQSSVASRVDFSAAIK